MWVFLFRKLLYGFRVNFILNFDVLLIVQLSIFISVFNQLDAHNFCFTISLFHASTCFEHHVLIIRRSKLHYTASSIITPIGDDEHMCSKHVEAWNILIVKQKLCASSWLNTEINILRCTVSETSKHEDYVCKSVTSHISTK